MAFSLVPPIPHKQRVVHQRVCWTSLGINGVCYREPPAWISPPQWDLSDAPTPQQISGSAHISGKSLAETNGEFAPESIAKTDAWTPQVQASLTDFTISRFEVFLPRLPLSCKLALPCCAV